MRKRGIWGFIAVILTILAVRAVSLAQKSEGPHGPPQVGTKSDPKRWSPRTKPVADDEDPPAALPPTRSRKIDSDEAPLPPTRSRTIDSDEAPAVDDPLGIVESFLSRNRKEADDSIKNLSQEAETLRARLQKVEAALAKWQAVAEALNSGSLPSNVNLADPPGTILEPIRSAPTQQVITPNPGEEILVPPNQPGTVLPPPEVDPKDPPSLPPPKRN